MAEDEEYFEDAELDFDELAEGDYGLEGQGGWADDDPDTITLEYDDGSSEECDVLGIFPYDGREYIALAPEDDQGSLYLYGYVEHDDGTNDIVPIEDDAEFDAVAAEYQSLME
ncbi:DUF1292 domain-containing protein [Tractidigestivibacter sp.]|uniref:DUF1292 domain-containing protein n=1 Tax=Tractidigestivibacter sp. TaxID=2847320 RepID=UPI002A90E322|nr:DUF1292 domain-containing protein [Tractidigestivibacter sp.]MDY5272445.1 DUF1292 domain-containing protein [Tractidigestivibacter sp.]